MPHVTDTQESCRSNAESEYDEVNEVVVCPCLPPVQADIPSKHGSGCFSIFRLILSWILFVVSFPFVILFTWTIPNCSTPETKKYYLFSFLMSISWIATLSFAMVTLVGRAGCILGIDKFTMGLVVVAIGTSIPVSYMLYYLKFLLDLYTPTTKLYFTSNNVFILVPKDLSKKQKSLGTRVTTFPQNLRFSCQQLFYLRLFNQCFFIIGCT